MNNNKKTNCTKVKKLQSVDAIEFKKYCHINTQVIHSLWKMIEALDLKEMIEDTPIYDEDIIALCQAALVEYQQKLQGQKSKKFHPEEWAINIMNKYPNFYNTHCHTRDQNKPITVVTVWDKRIAHFRHGIAVCSKNDIYNPAIGTAVAICHALKIPVPKEI